LYTGFVEGGALHAVVLASIETGVGSSKVSMGGKLHWFGVGVLGNRWWC